MKRLRILDALRRRLAPSGSSMDRETDRLEAELHEAVVEHREERQRISKAADRMAKIAAESIEALREERGE